MRTSSLRFHYPENYSHDEIALSEEGWSYSPEDTHFGVWIRKAGTIIHDIYFVHWIVSKISDKPIGTIIEVGANIGTHSCAYMRMCDHLICFEPFGTSFECLHRNILKQSVYSPMCSVDAYCAAAGAQSGAEGLTIDANHGASHITPSVMTENLIRCFPLDDFNPQKSVRLIKIDAEGFEPMVLIGAQNLIEQHHPEIVLEVNHGALARYGYNQDSLVHILHKMGYHACGVWPLDIGTSIDQLQDTPQYDIHFRPNEDH
jgi:FkbM family methyltransferase